MSVAVNVKSANNKGRAPVAGTARDFLTLTIAGQLFGIPVLQVQDVLGAQHVTIIPLASPEIAGYLNLRGRIVTAINVRRRLGLPEPEGVTRNMSVVVDHEGELYSLIIDRVGDVLPLRDDDFETSPATLDPLWRSIAQGIYQLEDRLLIVVDVQKLLNFGQGQS